MKKLLFILLVFVGVFSSCTDLSDKLYDRIPSANFPENENQTALMMIPIYKPLQDYLDWGGYWFAQELTSDEMVCPTRGTDWDDGGKWRVLHTHTWTNDVEATNSMWSRFYKGIYQANKLIEFLQPAVDKGNKTALATVAKSKVMRDFYYWNAIDNYGDVPYITSFANAPTFPKKVKRAVIWKDIVDELQSVIPYLKTSGSKYGVTKGMAFMLLAKLYLNAEVYTGTPQWQKAEDFCDSIINLNAYSLESDPLAPFVTENENSSENIFTIGYDENNYKGFNLHMRTLHYQSKYTYDMTVQPWNGFAAMEDFYNTFSANDKRKKMFLVGTQYSYTGQVLTDPGAGGDTLKFDPHIPALKMDASYSLDEIRMSGARVVKFQVKLGATDNLSNDFPIFRYADVLLMKAECEIRLHGPGAGDTWINMIKNRAGIATPGNYSLDDLLAERGREMTWEAQRRMDLIRFGKYLDPWWEKPADDSPDRTTFPIPKWVQDANPNLAN